MSGKKELYLLFNFTYVKCLLYNLFKFHLKAQHTTTQMWQINIGLDAGILGISIGQKYLAAQKTVNKLGNIYTIWKEHKEQFEKNKRRNYGKCLECMHDSVMGYTLASIGHYIWIYQSIYIYMHVGLIAHTHHHARVRRCWWSVFVSYRRVSPLVECLWPARCKRSDSVAVFCRRCCLSKRKTNQVSVGIEICNVTNGHFQAEQSRNKMQSLFNYCSALYNHLALILYTPVRWRWPAG